MLAGWIWSSPIGSEPWISWPSLTAPRSICEGKRPVERSASATGNSSPSTGSLMAPVLSQAGRGEKPGGNFGPDRGLTLPNVGVIGKVELRAEEASRRMVRGGLFTRFFLEDGIRELPAYRRLDTAILAEFAGFVHRQWKNLAEMPHPNEGETESEFIY